MTDKELAAAVRHGHRLLRSDDPAVVELQRAATEDADTLAALAYADWLEEQGDDEHARYQRLCAVMDAAEEWPEDEEPEPSMEQPTPVAPSS